MLKDLKDKKPKYYLNDKGEFVIENYNFSKPFANFFPGIAGKYGIPMWVFYVNRSQGIISFGTKDKDHAILEFFPANKAWQLVSTYGFRTFIKISRRGSKQESNHLNRMSPPNFYEPFHNGFSNLGFKLSNSLFVTPEGMALEEKNLTLGISIKVEYFNIPNDSYAGLARIVTIKNLSKETKKIQLLDGLPQIIPYGTSNMFLKKLGRTIEAWMKVKNLDKDVPFYKLDVDPTDRPEVIHIEGGNFYLGFHYEKNKPKLIKPIVDPQYIFGPVTDFSCPSKFLASANLAHPKEEIIKSKMPCGFLLVNLELAPKQEKTFYSVIGHMRNLEALNSSIPRITASDYLENKKEENKKIIKELQQDIATTSSSKEFNLYCQQTYLDNIIRGGYPLTLDSGAVFYLYSRKHGDLERDYNKFQIQPSYFSQGNGNYRDVNQNRRCDTWFHPEIKDDNLINLFNLIQADGFNPLVVKGTSFILKNDSQLKTALNNVCKENDILKIVAFLNKSSTPTGKSITHDKHSLSGFTPGDLILFIEENNIKLKVSYDEFLSIVISHSLKIQEAEHGEGFWTDHWTYNLDLLDSYLGLYPEKLKEIFFDKKIFTFYDNTETVKPRSEKYLLKDGVVKQLHAVAPDNAKREMIRKRQDHLHNVRAQYGLGEIYQTTLINKLFCLLVNKLASFDPSGMGIEMEADKPNWFDALNGLPALFGSSLCETFELKRLVILLKSAIEKSGVERIYLSEEIRNFLFSLYGLIKEYSNSGLPDKDYRYWDKSYSLKEDYRNKIRFGFSGKELEAKSGSLLEILDNALGKINSGIERSRDKKGNIYYSYFIHEVKDYEIIKDHFAKPKEFVQKKLPFFLESQVHALRLAENTNEAKSLYKATKSSLLYDRKLKMYKVTAPLASMPEEIGRCRVFTPGWLENESIWLHMEYKYLLEILKSGLYEEFYQEFKNLLIPFQKPEKYGRNILENSSFLVSSAFPDKNLQGNGFVARLSGSTAEFLQIWLIINAGRNPFFLNKESELNFRLKPILSGWLFDRKGIYSFNFLSKICVVYHNSKRKNTFGKNSVKATKITFDDKDNNPVEIHSETIPAPYAEQIRSRQINKIDVYLE